MTKYSAVFDEVAAANNNYVRDFGDKGKVALPPARGFAILTCMDARLDPAKYAGLAQGDADVIRNAGGLRRRHPFSRHLPQIARNERMVRDPSRRLRNAIIRQRGHRGSSGG